MFCMVPLFLEDKPMYWCTLYLNATAGLVSFWTKRMLEVLG